MVVDKSKKSNGGDGGANAEERISALFQPDTLVTHQYLDTYRRQLPLEPESVWCSCVGTAFMRLSNFSAAHSEAAPLGTQAWILPTTTIDFRL
jgi:hypothetical protein